MGLFSRIAKALEEMFTPDYRTKGEIGEDRVNNILLCFKEATIFYNYTFYDKYKKSHQIDHIIIKENGIFVIETKNVYGNIYGKEDMKDWDVYQDQTYVTIRNPVKQNDSHVFHITQILNYKYDIHSIVVFVRDNAGKINIENVINLNELYSYLKNFPCKRKLNKQEIHNIFVKLAKKETYISEETHREIIEKTQHDIDNDICPFCGGKLVVRNGKYGQFKGCSNYPKCTFKKKL